ncbi:MAG: RDD family protein [Deltaproteobacteria bacterium]
MRCTAVLIDEVDTRHDPNRYRRPAPQAPSTQMPDEAPSLVEEDDTILGMPIPDTVADTSARGIDEIHFDNEGHTAPSLDADTDEDMYADETIVAEVQSKRPAPPARTARAEPWRDVADAARGPADRRFVDDQPTNVPLTRPKPKSRAQTDAALSELKSWAENRQRSRSTNTPHAPAPREKTAGMALPSFPTPKPSGRLRPKPSKSEPVMELEVEDRPTVPMLDEETGDFVVEPATGDLGEISTLGVGHAGGDARHRAPTRVPVDDATPVAGSQVPARRPSPRRAKPEAGQRPISPPSASMRAAADAARSVDHGARRAEAGRADERGHAGRRDPRADAGPGSDRADAGRREQRPAAGPSNAQGHAGRANDRAEAGRANERGTAARANDRAEAGRANERGTAARANDRAEAGRANERGNVGRANERDAGRRDPRAAAVDVGEGAAGGDSFAEPGRSNPRAEAGRAELRLGAEHAEARRGDHQRPDPHRGADRADPHRGAKSRGAVARDVDQVAPTRPTPVGSAAAAADPSVRAYRESQPDPASDLILTTPGGGTPALRPQKIVPNPPPPRAPRGVTRSIASDALSPVVPTDLDDAEPSGESTRLGNLADPSADLLMAMPVHHDRPADDEGPSETIAAPGQLAGAAPRSLSGLVKDLDAGPSEPMSPPPILSTASEVRRGLAEHLGGEKDSRTEDQRRLRNARSETTDPEMSDVAGPDTGGREDTKRLGKEVVQAVFAQEETAGLLEALESGPDTAPVLDDPAPDVFRPTPLQLDPSAPTGASPSPAFDPASPTGDQLMPLGVDVSFDAIPATTDASDSRRRLAVGARRFGAVLIDATILVALIAAPALFGVFSEAIPNASLVEPDDVAALLVDGHLTLPLVFGVVLYLVYSVLAHTFGGRTLGKLALGLELVNTKTGERVTPLRAILRAVFGLVGLLAGGIGYFWLLLDRRGRTLHDHLARTTVVLAER